MNDPLQILRDFTDRLKKAMSPEVLHSITKRHRMEKESPDFIVSKDITTARELGSRNIGAKFERVVMPSEVATPETAVYKSDTYSDCPSCGYMYKSILGDCPKCITRYEIKEAVPFYKRLC